MKGFHINTNLSVASYTFKIRRNNFKTYLALGRLKDLHKEAQLLLFPVLWMTLKKNRIVMDKI